jgi:hypothetical protein
MEKYIAGAFGLLLGTIGILLSLVQLRNIASLKKWKTAQGTIIERGTFKPDTPSLSSPAYRFSPLIKYRYVVDEKEYSNDSLLPKHIHAPPTGRLEWAKKRAALYFNDDITIYYNPENPADSFLEQVPNKTMYIVGAVSLLVFIYSAIYMAL